MVAVSSPLQSSFISKVVLTTELLTEEANDEETLLEDELELLDDLLEDEQLEFDELELELELELEKKSLLELEELLELELELEQLVSGGLNGVVRSAPQPCNSKVDNKKNANALNEFGWRKEKLIIAL